MEYPEINTGDTVYHEPSGEEWVVAFVENGRLWWLGWPLGSARFEDCRLLKKATEEERIRLLGDMAKVMGDDPRGIYARRVLGGE